ncbi:MAG TPA: PIG-L family deacetylase [Terracidiphilus sp.]|nr:PIG-L family deacetylase [Terracidiphilus sp.]
MNLVPQELLARATAREGDVTPMPRALLVFAHPDDETVGLGARLRRFRQAHLIIATDGVPRDEEDSRTHGFPSAIQYRHARARELDDMLSSAGVGHMFHDSLGISDQQASFQLPALTRRIAEHIRSFRPEVIVTHPYEGGHPDHDACAFAVHYACVLAASPSGVRPLVAEAAFYHAGPAGLKTEVFLANPAEPQQVVRVLSPKERTHKRQRLDCFYTQRVPLALFPCTAERFRFAPHYDFTRPPHSGPTWYDHFPWGITSGRFCRLAAEAARELRSEVGSAWG